MKLFPHAQLSEKQHPIDDRAVREWAQILRKARWYAWARGAFREVERMFEKSAAAMRKALSDDVVEMLYSLGILTSTYRNQGRWTDTEKMEV
jgi:hypothetical protein